MNMIKRGLDNSSSMSCHSWCWAVAVRLTQLQKTRCWPKLLSPKFKVNKLYLVFGANFTFVFGC